MKKGLFLSRFMKQKNNSLEQDQIVKVLLPDIPSYGIKGSICRIEETEESYYKVLYQLDGTTEKIPVPKKKQRNFSSIVDDYYKDLKKYLDLNHGKYHEYKENRLKQKMDKKFVQIGVLVSFGMALISLPILVSTTYIGAFLEAISILFLYLTCDLKREIVEDEEKHTFIKQYDSYQTRLVDHNVMKANQNNQSKRTVYTEISSKQHKISKEDARGKKRTLIKEKEELREAA